MRVRIERDRVLGVAELRREVRDGHATRDLDARVAVATRWQPPDDAVSLLERVGAEIAP